MKYNRIPETLFIKNRSKLYELLLPGSTVIIHSNDEMHRNGDQNYRFRQSSDFFYLTGIDQEKTMLVLSPKHPEEHLREILFIPNVLPEQVIWNGKRLGLKEAEELSGIKNVRWVEDFDKVLPEVLFKSVNIYLNIPEHLKYRPDIETRDGRMAKKVQACFPLHSYHRLSPFLSKIRMIKEPEEIALIQRSLNITRDAFYRVCSFVKPGVMEYEIEAEITYEFLRKAANGHAYEPIIASGENACILHYIENNKECLDGELLLMDFGAEYANYAADITRTVPVNGRFTSRQANLYDSCLQVLRTATGMMKPGILLADFHAEITKIWEEEHIRLGLYSKKDSESQKPGKNLWFKYYMHGTSHSIGLDVHDPFDKAERFQPGMVFSCEPAIYISEEGVGIRLENDILITESGNIDLCADIPLEREEIEDLMNS